MHPLSCYFSVAAHAEVDEVLFLKERTLELFILERLMPFGLSHFQESCWDIIANILVSQGLTKCAIDAY
jgi:hypothetical protein